MGGSADLIPKSEVAAKFTDSGYLIDLFCDFSLDVGHWTFLLLRPLIARHVLINVFHFVIAILNDCLHHVVLVDDDRLLQN